MPVKAGNANNGYGPSPQSAGLTRRGALDDRLDRRAPRWLPCGRRRARGRLHRQLPFGQGVELKAAAFVPKPDIGVNHAAHVHGHRKGRSSTHHALNFGNHLGRMLRRPHPIEPPHRAPSVDGHIEHPDRIEQRWHLALEDTLTVGVVQMQRAVLPISLRGGGSGDSPGRLARTLARILIHTLTGTLRDRRR